MCTKTKVQFSLRKEKSSGVFIQWFCMQNVSFLLKLNLQGRGFKFDLCMFTH